MKSNRMVFFLSLLLALMLTAAGYAQEGKVYNLKFSYHTPPKAVVVPTYFNPWTASIEQAANGRVKIVHYAGESLVKAKDQYDAVISGMCDIALVDPDRTTPGDFQ